jgi:hypothetical protein
VFKIWQTFGSYQIFSRKKEITHQVLGRVGFLRGRKKLTGGNIKVAHKGTGWSNFEFPNA